MKTKDFILLLVIGFFSTFVSFSATLYVNSDYILELIDYLFTEQREKTLDSSQLNTAENYIPRDFSGKIKSLNYDFYIKYQDFDYRKSETLTYQTRKYFNNISISFRFPKKKSTSALLLIFHSCKDSPYDWFHTPERQRIIGAAIDLSYACLVFQANDKCWSNDPDLYANKDIQMVFKGLEAFYKDYPELG
jgi:hypothetical protein